jgi:hypothetical protein
MAGTQSTVTLFQQLRKHILEFEPPANVPLSVTLGDELDGRFWLNAGPTPDEDPESDPIYPYVVGRFLNQQITQAGQRWRADFEIYVYDRPRSRQLAAETIADRILGALLGYRDARYGFVMANPPTKDTLPPTPPPGDRELVQVRLVAEIVAYPQLLEQYAYPGYE